MPCCVRAVIFYRPSAAGIIHRSVIIYLSNDVQRNKVIKYARVLTLAIPVGNNIEILVYFAKTVCTMKQIVHLQAL